MATKGTDKFAQVLAQNNKAINSARRSDVRSASWLKIVVFAIPVIVVIIGVIWASTL